MKALIINGSPKKEKSNTMNLTKSFINGCGWSDTETINVYDKNIQPCLGCFSCWRQTPGKCVIKDDMIEILNKIIVADVIIWSFPLYYYNVPGALKTLIDRQLPLSLPIMSVDCKSGGHPSRYDRSHQKHILISTCGFWTAEGNYDSVVSMFDHFCEKDNYSSLFCGQGELFNIPELKTHTDKYLNLISQAGLEYVQGGIHEDTISSLLKPIFSRDVFEQMANASWDVPKNETQTDDSFVFTRQMATLYQHNGVDHVLEFYYTDIDKTYQLLLTAEGAKVIAENFKPYTTKIETPYSLWRSISRGEISGEDALFRHLYSVKGDFNLIMNWNKLFGTSSEVETKVTNSPKNDAPKKTNMLLLLAPWTLIWIFLPINSFIGALLGVASSALMPLLWLKLRPVVYEQITVPVVTGLSLAALSGVNTTLILIASYFSFGLLWTIGSLPSIPLTAHYSYTGHGGEKAFSNLLFIRTNRILTLVWGILYLLTPIWTYKIMGTELSSYVGLINSITPALMGIFTTWFKRWYPAYYASKKA